MPGQQQEEEVPQTFTYEFLDKEQQWILLCRPVEVSSICANSGVLLAHVVSTARKRQLSKLQDTLRNSFQRSRKETDIIWPSFTSTGLGQVRATPKRLVDVISPSCIFRASIMEWKKSPVWQLKSDKPGLNHSTDLASDFFFKAHNYMLNMRLRDRPNSYRCFFQQQNPTYHVVDGGVQSPDVSLTRDRSSNVKEPLSENRIPEHCNVGGPHPAQFHPPITEDKVGQESSTVRLGAPSKMNSSSMKYIGPENQNQPHLTNLNVIVACDKPLYSTSECQTASSDAMGQCQVAVAKIGTERESSMNLPYSNKCHVSSSQYPAISTTASFQPRSRKVVRSKWPHVAEDLVSKRCKVRNQRLPVSNHFCRIYRAFCDKRKIKIKYENGRYTVLKELGKSKRRTIWSIFTGKATHLLKSVMRRKRHAHQASGR